MFDNVVRLIGFVGSGAELKTTKTQREYTVLSLATTASWKDKNGDPPLCGDANDRQPLVAPSITLRSSAQPRRTPPSSSERVGFKDPPESSDPRSHPFEFLKCLS